MPVLFQKDYTRLKNDAFTVNLQASGKIFSIQALSFSPVQADIGCADTVRRSAPSLIAEGHPSDADPLRKQANWVWADL
jgi:hypothetical protein